MAEMEDNPSVSGASEEEAMEDDDLFDLNKEPIEKKRKRVENSSPGNEKERRFDGVHRVTRRVLRSATKAMNNAEKQVIETEVAMKEELDLVDEHVSPTRKKLKGRRGRPPKREDNNSEENAEESNDEVIEKKNVEESHKGTGRGRRKVKGRLRRSPQIEQISGTIGKKRKTKRPRGRPPKIKNEILEKKTKRLRRTPKKENGVSSVIVKEKCNKGRFGRPPKVDKSADGDTDMKFGTDGGEDDGGEESLKRDANDLRASFETCESGRIKNAELKQFGRREQQQLVRDQIVALLKTAGWTIEYRPRQSRDYNDPVYVDRDGRGYWSCTLAYRMLKKRIDDGKAYDEEVSSFSPIPEQSLSLLFRVRQDENTKNKKVTVKKGKVIAKKVLSKTKTLGKRMKSKSSKGKRALLARKPGEGSDDYELYDGKRTLLSWMIDLGTVVPDGKVKYKRGRNRKVMCEGRITRDGIVCSCCDEIHTIQSFKSHAESEPQDPYKYIYLESGNTLFQCLIDSWKKQLANDDIGFNFVDVDGDDPNDDTCNICGDGGNLICCDSCPSTFHQSCLCIKNFPSGDWYCLYCSCKFCGMSGGNASSSDDNNDSIVSELLMCRLCEEKFHVPCMEGNDGIVLDDNNPSFCGRECQKIFECLRALLGIRRELDEEYSYTILQRGDISCDASVSGDILEVERNSKLAVAFSVMDECFMPIIDERSKTNVIHNVVYGRGSNFRRLNFGGFYTVILEKKNDEVVAAASIRIHGSQLAEMPFIGTRYTYRRQGLCRRLLTAIETVLRDLGIGKIVIPAISELNETWTKNFHFAPLEELKRQEMRSMSMVVFPGTDMLQKPLLEVERATTDKKSTEAPMELQNTLQEPNDDGGVIAATEVPIFPEFEIQNSESNIKVGADEESVNHEKEESLLLLPTTNDDNDPFSNSKITASDAHQLEAQITVEDISSCSNSVQLVKCN